MRIALVVFEWTGVILMADALIALWRTHDPLMAAAAAGFAASAILLRLMSHRRSAHRCTSRLIATARLQRES